MPEHDESNRYLLDTAWLQDHLDDLDLRVLDCTVYLPNYFEESAQEKVEIIPAFRTTSAPTSREVSLLISLAT